MKEGTGLKFGRGGRSDLEEEAAENLRRRAGRYCGGGRSSESKQGEAARVGSAERIWAATECMGYEREYIRSVLFTHGASADLARLAMSAPI